jgi:hypothetical protein
VRSIQRVDMVSVSNCTDVDDVWRPNTLSVVGVP